MADDSEEVLEATGQAPQWSLLQGDPNDVIPEDQLPFTRLKLIDDEEEDLLESVRLGTLSKSA